MSELVLVPIGCALVSGAIGALTKLALSDRDARIKNLETDQDELKSAIASVRVDVAVTKSEAAALLRQAGKLETKLDTLLERLP